MSKRLGKRERARARQMAGEKRETVNRNLSSPPERPMQVTRHAGTGSLSVVRAAAGASERNRLLSHSHAGFRDPKGNLAKAHTERAKPIGQHRFMFVDQSGDTFGGTDRKAELPAMRERLRLKSVDAKHAARFRKLRAVDTRPWLDGDGNVQAWLDRFNAIG